MRRNVLVVDDDKDFQLLLESYLEHAGFVVRCVSDGYSALDELSANDFDLVILDISMPNFNGFQFLHSIRAIDALKDLPIIMLTASSEKDDILRAKDNVSDYMLKPPSREELLARIERILGGRPQFYEVKFSENDSITKGRLKLPLRLISCSQRGLVFSSPVELRTGPTLGGLELAVFHELGVRPTGLRIISCRKTDAGDYECFTSFLGLDTESRKKVQQWVVHQSFRR